MKTSCKQFEVELTGETTAAHGVHSTYVREKEMRLRRQCFHCSDLPLSVARDSHTHALIKKTPLGVLESFAHDEGRERKHYQGFVVIRRPRFDLIECAEVAMQLWS